MPTNSKQKQEKISHEELVNILIYDPKTGLFTRRNSSYSLSQGQVCGCLTKEGYVTIMVNYTTFYAHRLAWFYVHKEWPENQIDHINRIKSDNRISNLRKVDRFENAKNLSKSKRNKSGIIGIRFRSKSLSWEARIRVNNKEIHIGSFSCKQKAIQARKDAEIKYGFTVPD